MNWFSVKALGLMAMGLLSLRAFAQEPEAVPGEYLVKLKDLVSVQKAEVSWLERKLGGKVLSLIPEQNLVVLKVSSSEKRSLVVSNLESRREVEFAEPNYIFRINKVSNDPLLGQLWGLKNTGAPDSRGQVGVAGIDVNAEAAWDIETGSKDVVIAVIDTGVDFNHQDIKDNMWVNEIEKNGQPGVDDDANGIVDDIHGASFVEDTPTGNPLDDHSHGTHCAGTIGGHGDNNLGVVGVNWNTRIMAVKFLGSGGSGSLDGAVKSINYATKMGARIMSNSWGGGPFTESLKLAIEDSHKAGALFVAAAGNDSNDNDVRPSYPASYQVPNVVSVAAIDNQGKLASFSSFGKNSVHIGAPGVNVLSSVLGNNYQVYSGTSMATPHVSGVAGLVLSHSPNLTNIELRERLLATARPIASLKNKVSSKGMVNAEAALKNQLPEPDPNDPANWSSIEANISTEHPYKNKVTQEFNVKVEGAKEIAIFFSKFQTENRYDTVTIFDSTGKKVAVLSGNHDETFSEVVQGETAKIVFVSDDTQTAYGFDITKIAWR